MSAAETRALRPDAPRAGEKRWRRRCLWALAALLPAALAVTTYGSALEFLSQHDVIARDVAGGVDVAFAGSTWRLDRLRTAEGVDPARLPAGAVPVLADLSVTIGDADLQKLWLGCKIRVTDAAGRSWDPVSIFFMKMPESMKSCTSAMLSGARSGDTLDVRETFIVPRDVAGELRVTLGLAGERPYYLRFGRPED